MTEPTTSPPELKRSLGMRDLILLNISCMVGLGALSRMALFGLGSIVLYLLAIIMFVIPCGLMVAELNARMPEEGGFYLWVKNSFGIIINGMKTALR